MDRLSELLRDFDPARPLQRASTIPSNWYTSAAMFDAERAAIFGESWQMVGRVEQVADPGQFLTEHIAGEPVLVVRGEDGVLRAFHNVCRHRAASLLTQDCGQVSKLRCRYHGWTYDLAGRLRGTPEFEGVCGFAKEDHGLVPMSVAEHGMFVWVKFGESAEPLEAYVAPLPSFPKLGWRERRIYDLACNWKVYVDNYLDGGYHVNTVHPALAGVLDYSRYTTTVAGWTVLQSSPLTPGEGDAGRTRKGSEAAYWWVFPNVMFNMYDGVMDTNRVLPLGVDRCRVVFDFYFAEGTPGEFIRESVAVADRVQAEDAAICEEVQRGLASRAFTQGRFSVKRENGGYAFHQMLALTLHASALTQSSLGAGN